MKRGGGGGEVAELKERVQHLSENTERSKSVVDRLSGRRFWREPSREYVKMAAEIRELEALLVRAGHR